MLCLLLYFPLLRELCGSVRKGWVFRKRGGGGGGGDDDDNHQRSIAVATADCCFMFVYG